MSKTQILATAVISDQTADRSPLSPDAITIAGYQLQERIGVGGYGEVWRAIGPGGFPKAVKILYGQVDGPQAETELKSLNLMRELRHPFLLNVERVEFVGGRVVVVTELADRSLDQRFDEAVKAGRRGIPRDELLGYLRDAADALDFMSESHGLQHLDIKPENILIQGTHGKVGDFGLTKSVAMIRASLINGFTPLYAPPELFEGQASAHSDQYSLAIVYQVMLTGVQPFNGRTAAQLASQHLKGTPDLSILTLADRGVVARALSRNPGTRYGGCRQFIEDLSRRRQVSVGSPRGRVSSAAPAVRVVSGLTPVINPAVLGKSASTPLRLAAPAAPLSEDKSQTEFHPALIISVGGLGARVLRELRQQLRDQYAGKTLPAIEFLCLDSDKDELSQIRQADTASGTPPVRTLQMPLRSSQEYRKTAADHLQWLSRRWLFNIPRSGNVEGMRPLGRLAFIDNQQHVQKEIYDLLQKICSPEAIRKTGEESGLNFVEGAVDVCLVGSASGGTSSGCMIDLGFLIRSMLRKNQPQSSDVSAVLLHATSAGRQNSDTQDANSVSLLQELHYHGLVGQQSPGITPSESSCRPFDTTWFLHLGDDLSSTDYGMSAAKVADYLFHWMATDARRDLSLWRRAERTRSDSETALSIRTLGSASIDGSAWVNATSQAEQLVGHLLRYWQTSVTPSKKTPQDRLAREAHFGREVMDELDSLMDTLMLSNRRIGEFVPSLLRGEIGKRIEHYTADVWKRITQHTTQISDLSELVNTLATMIGSDTNAESAAVDSVARITQTVRQELAGKLQQASTRIRQKVSADLDRPHRMALAGLTMETLQAAAEQAIQSCAVQKSDVQKAFADLCSSYIQTADQNPGSLSQSAARGFCQQYCMLLVCQTVCQCAAGHLAGLRDALSKIQSEQLAGRMKQIQALYADVERRISIKTPMPDPVISAFDRFVAESGQFQLSALVRSTNDPGHLPAGLVSAAFSFLMSHGDGAEASEERPERETNSNFPANAHPLLCNVGGHRRVLALLPRTTAVENWKTRLQAEFGNCVTIRQSDRREVTAYCEVEGIQLPDVIGALTSLRPRVTELAQRVHTRTDIAW